MTNIAQLQRILDGQASDLTKAAGHGREPAQGAESVLTGVAAQVVTFLERAGFNYDANGKVSVTDVAETTDQVRLTKTEAAQRSAVLGETPALGPVRAPAVTWTVETGQSAQAFANTLDQAGAGAMQAVYGSKFETEMVRMRSLSADLLLAIFLKLNVTDPNNSVETHNKLTEVMTELRELAILEAKKKIEVAQQLMKEADSSGGYFDAFGIITQIIGAIATIVSMGAAAPAVVAAQTAMQSGQQAIQQAVQQAVKQVAGQIRSLTQKQVQQVLQSMSEKQLQQLAQQMAQNMSKEMAQNLTQNLGTMTKDQLVQTLSEPAMREALATTVEQQLTVVTTDVAQQTADYAAELKAQGLPQQEFQQAVQEFYGKALQEGIQSQFGAGIMELSSVKELVATLPSQFAQSFSAAFQTALQTQTSEQITQGAIAKIKRDPLSIFKGGNSPLADKLKLASTVGKGVADVGKAQQQAESAAKAAAAAAALNDAKRLRLLAELAQQQVEAENEVIRMIMESKNQTVDAVIKMMNAMFASSTKLLSASMSR